MRLWQPSGSLDEKLDIAALGCTLYVDADALWVSFESKRTFLSSSVHYGGLQTAQHFINVRVGPSCPLIERGPTKIICDAQEQRQIIGSAVGMMTAVSMKSSRVCIAEFEGECLAVALTSGVKNARCAGDHAEHRSLYDNYASSVDDIGTINIIVMTSFPLNQAALVESVMIASEAKCACLKKINMLSKVSNDVATGTGTDAIAVASPTLAPDGNTFSPTFSAQKQSVRFAGKHTIVGEQLARALIMALESSLEYTQLSNSGTGAR